MPQCILSVVWTAAYLADYEYYHKRYILHSTYRRTWLALGRDPYNCSHRIEHRPLQSETYNAMEPPIESTVINVSLMNGTAAGVIEEAGARQAQNVLRSEPMEEEKAAQPATSMDDVD